MGKTVLNVWGMGLLFAGLLLPAATALAAGSDADEKVEAKPVYQLDFTIRELEDGKTVNSRNYRMLIEEEKLRKSAGSTIRTGSKVAITAFKGEIEYVDVGINIDCNLEERQETLGLSVALEINDISPPDAESGLPQFPVIRQIRSRVNTGIVPGKPTVITSIDDATTKRRYELEVTATKIS